jgi:diaminohydroxyphosphoribosylaminopyrimidine deaminase/5-amino-6-(5-phosphoribosylamino)uracil reductase
MAGSLNDRRHMLRAVHLAARGQGLVEPNPMVGCVIAAAAEDPLALTPVIAEGWHQTYGGPHAEIVALEQAGPRAAGATMYVTLEPCCHHGKTPPCTRAVLSAGLARIVIAHPDPFPEVTGRGIGQLKAAGLPVEVGVVHEEAQRLNAPYVKLVKTGRPWVMAKWAMTLDGKLATRSGHSRWISGDASRAIVHQLRGRVDALLIGRGTAQTDDPLLTARPPGPRVATRIVVDSRAALASDRQLVRTARQVPVIVAVSSEADPSERQRLVDAGCEVVECPGKSHAERLGQLLDCLGQRRMTNVLVEGGSRLLGSLWDATLIDEVHVFVSPKLVGGDTAPGPLGGTGLAQIPPAPNLTDVLLERLDDDMYIRGRIARNV